MNASQNDTSPPIETQDVEDVHAPIGRAVLDALDRYAQGEAIDRPQAIRAILADWLRTHGFKITSGVKPIGPATDAVDAMDAAIRKDAEAKRRRR